MSKNANRELDFALELDFSQVLTNPILDIAARFWDDDRYQAFKICYRTMRRIDDLVDDRKAVGDIIPAGEAAQLQETISSWLKMAQNGVVEDSFHTEFLTVLDRFAIPFWPWERLGSAMIYDLHHNGFANFRTFLRYAEGAAISPAAVFMHLCGVRPDGKHFSPPEYDIREAARALALFSYVVHIIRDFQKDQMENLNYFAENLLSEHSLSVPDLAAIAGGGEIGVSFRNLIRQYRSFADYYRRKARLAVDRVAPKLQPRYHLSLEIIYGLYFQIFERIDPERGNFTGTELNPPPDEIHARISLIVRQFHQSRIT